MNAIVTKIKRYGFFALPLVAPLFAFAQGIKGPGITIPTSNIKNLNDVGSSIATAGQWMFYFLAILAVIFILVAAYKYLTSGGDPEKVKSAGQTVIYAAVAIVIGIIAFTFPGIVESIFSGSGSGTGSVGGQS